MMAVKTAKKTRKHFENLRREFLILKPWIENEEQLAWRAPEVSGWSIAQQVEHLLLTDANILRLISERDPEIFRQGKAKPKLVGHMVLLVGFRKRGLAKSPKQVVPRDCGIERLRELALETEERFVELDAILDTVDFTRWIYPHPLLGDFSAQQWLRFNEVHHQHHHRIVADIREACLRTNSR